jgi:hypothetical protein
MILALKRIWEDWGGGDKNKAGYYVFTVTSRTAPSNEQSAVRFDACM